MAVEAAEPLRQHFEYLSERLNVLLFAYLIRSTSTTTLNSGTQPSQPAPHLPHLPLKWRSHLQL